VSAATSRTTLPGADAARLYEPRPSGGKNVCWESAGVVLDRLDRELQDFSERCAAQKTRYGGELYPPDWAAQPGGTSFRDYFQRDAITKQPKASSPLT
jgi:hypothetical protein